MLFKKKKKNDNDILQSHAEECVTSDELSDATCNEESVECVSERESPDPAQETSGAEENESCDDTETADVDENIAEDADEPGETADSDPEMSDFEASIKNFTVSDADVSVAVKKKGFDVFRLAVIVVCSCAFVISTYILVGNIHDKIKSEQIYGDIIDSFGGAFTADGGVISNGGKITLLASDSKSAYTPTMDEIIKNGVGNLTSPSDNSAELAKMRASLESLKNINPDIYAWIKIPGTSINYPVAQTDNNEYYLDHAYTGDNLVNGSIYADFRCSDSITDNYNTVLYGHNITSGSMFHDVEKFFKEEVFNSTLIYLYTFDGIYVFKPFAVHETSFDSGFVDTYFPTPESFTAFANGLSDSSELKYEHTFTGDDRILTLSTCTNGIASKRYALHALLVESITN